MTTPRGERRTSDRALTPETRAAKMAATDLGSVMELIRGESKGLFMQAKRSPRLERMRVDIMRSPDAALALTHGVPVRVAYKVARADAAGEGYDPLTAILDERGEPEVFR